MKDTLSSIFSHDKGEKKLARLPGFSLVLVTHKIAATTDVESPAMNEGWQEERKEHEDKLRARARALAVRFHQRVPLFSSYTSNTVLRSRTVDIVRAFTR